MWATVNHTPYKADATWTRNKEGVHEWIVGVKATFDIESDGTLTLADEQQDLLLAPEYNGDAGLSSLRYDADLVGSKPTTDVILNATAYAPKGRPAKEFLVSVRVGPVHKMIKVLGKRKWVKSTPTFVPSSIVPIKEAPIVYENAYGGYDNTDPDPRNQRMDPRNPVGCGVVADENRLFGQELHNFEYPHKSVKKSGPAGFGPIDYYWSPRRELWGTYDEAWMQNRRPLLPKDWDPRSLLCSPIDQRPKDHLRGGEPVELINLTPDGVLRFTLPKIHLTFRTQINDQYEEHRSKLSSVIIEPDYPRVMLVWLSALLCRKDGDYLEQTVIREKPFI